MLYPLLTSHQDVIDAAKSGAVSVDLLDKVASIADEVDAEYLAEEIPSAIDQALEGVKRVSNIVLSMKEFSHPGSAAKSHIDINRALKTTITVSKNEWKYCAELVTDFDPGLPQVPCLPGELNQAFLNMIVNAAHAIESKKGEDSRELGTITITTSHDDDYATIRISDTGTGIPEDVRSRIFDPFFTTKDVGKGTGQGLAVARSVIVDKHGGALSVESTIGEGSTFVICLPLTEFEQSDD